MDLIDRSALQTAIADANWQFDNDLHTIEELVDSAPTIDAVPVIRCRDCGYAILDRLHKVKVERPPVWRCRKTGRLTVPDGFCHRGKIREEDENVTL